MEYKTIVIDSNIFIAFYNEADANHEHALFAVREFENSTLVVHPYVIQEVVTVLTYRFGLVVAKKFILDIRGSGNITIPGVDVVGDMQYFSQTNKKISFTDAALVRLVQSMNASLLTFDKQMLALFNSKKK